MTKNFDNAQLLSFVQRVEKLNEDQAAIAADLKEVMSAAKSAGYDNRLSNAPRLYYANIKLE